MTDTTTPNESPEETPVEEIPAPEVPPVRTTRIQVDFETEGADSVVYGSRLDHPYGSDPAQYAKTVAEYVERTVLLQLGALPVLAKIEVTP